MPVGDSEQMGSCERGIGSSVTIWWGSCPRVQIALGHCFLASSGSVERTLPISCQAEDGILIFFILILKGSLVSAHPLLDEPLSCFVVEMFVTKIYRPPVLGNDEVAVPRTESVWPAPCPSGAHLSPPVSRLQPLTSTRDAWRPWPRLHEHPALCGPAPTCRSVTPLEAGSLCSAMPRRVRGAGALGG